jgi:hypothetical protein
VSHYSKLQNQRTFGWRHPKGMINIHPTFIKEKLNAQLNGEGIGSGTLGDLRLTTRGIGEMEWPLLNSQFNFGSWQEVMGLKYSDSLKSHKTFS